MWGDNFGDLRAGDSVLSGRLKMENERIVRNALTDQGSDGHYTAVAQTEFIGAAPHFAEKDVVVEFREFGSEVA